MKRGQFIPHAEAHAAEVDDDDDDGSFVQWCS